MFTEMVDGHPRFFGAMFAPMGSHNFSIVSSFDFSDYSARAVLYRHSLGMEVLHVESDDNEYFFSYSFRTLPSDSTGVFHILEHTVLSGSRKYPVKDPFSLLDACSCNSYMNALTCPDRTLYPAASPVKKDFDNIFSLYTDSCFAPLLRRQDFESEGIRAGKKGFEGVVFNEMRGDGNQCDSLLSSHSRRDLFEGSPYSYSSGGDVKEMVNLTYETYRETYKKHYCPANCRLFICGKDIDIEEKLTFLEEEYLSKLEGGAAIANPEDTKRWSEPRKKTVPYQGQGEGEKGDFMISFLTKGKSYMPYDNLVASILVDALLGGSASPLYSALVDSHLGNDLSEQSGVSADFNEIPFAVGLTGVAEEKVEEAEAFILSAIERIAKDGIGEDNVEASIRRQEFLLQEVSGGIPNGFRIFLKCIRSWERGLDLGKAMDLSGSLARLREELEKNPRYFEDWMMENLVNNPHRLSIYMKPTLDCVQKEDALLKEAFKKQKAKTKEEKIVEDSYSGERKIDIPRLSLDDIREEEVTIHLDEVDEHILIQSESTCGITYITCAFDLSDLSSEDLLYAVVLSRYILMAGLEGEEAALFHRKLRLESGGYYAYLETGRAKDGEVKAFFAIRIKCLSRQSKICLDLLKDWIFRLSLTDEEKARNALSDLITDYEAYVEESGSSFASSLATSSLTPSLSLGEKLMGISSWIALSKTDGKTALKKMGEIVSLFKNRKRLILCLCSEEIEGKNSADLAKAFASSFPLSEEIKGGRGKEIEDACPLVWYTLPSSVAYNALAIHSSGICTKEQEAESIFSYILSTKELWQVLRMTNGAYGAEASLDSMEEVMVVATYRDPHIGQSFEAIKKAIKDVKISEEDIENCKLIRLGRLLKPLSPSQKTSLALRRYIYKISDEMRKTRRSYMKAVTLEDVEDARCRILSRLDEAGCATLGPISLFEKEPLEGATMRQLPF